MAPGIGKTVQRKEMAEGQLEPQSPHPIHREPALHTAGWCRKDGVSVFHMWLISWGQGGCSCYQAD